MAFMDYIRGFGMAMMNNKLITFLCVAVFAFMIATIALAAENNSNADLLQDCQARLYTATSTPAPATTTTTGDTGSTDTSPK
ncbi:uncharacterized protein LOC129740186 [Uranotaenia lowii]|uniref:uncharacterized protein LOC129740186 n=1 Tax=Uranotaenia lowii TaxID=190385 RepID=UPI002478AFC1|nr:uncharacterized protein LOC129740186 [Uranotaenia lowii]